MSHQNAPFITRLLSSNRRSTSTATFGGAAGPGTPSYSSLLVHPTIGERFESQRARRLRLLETLAASTDGEMMEMLPEERPDEAFERLFEHVGQYYNGLEAVLPKRAKSRRRRVRSASGTRAPQPRSSEAQVHAPLWRPPRLPKKQEAEQVQVGRRQAKSAEPCRVGRAPYDLADVGLHDSESGLVLEEADYEEPKSKTAEVQTAKRRTRVASTQTEPPGLTSRASCSSKACARQALAPAPAVPCRRVSKTANMMSPPAVPQLKEMKCPAAVSGAAEPSRPRRVPARRGAGKAIPRVAAAQAKEDLPLHSRNVLARRIGVPTVYPAADGNGLRVSRPVVPPDYLENLGPSQASELLAGYGSMPLYSGPAQGEPFEVPSLTLDSATLQLERLVEETHMALVRDGLIQETSPKDGPTLLGPVPTLDAVDRALEELHRGLAEIDSALGRTPAGGSGTLTGV